MATYVLINGAIRDGKIKKMKWNNFIILFQAVLNRNPEPI